MGARAAQSPPPSAGGWGHSPEGGGAGGSQLCWAREGTWKQEQKRRGHTGRENRSQVTIPHAARTQTRKNRFKQQAKGAAVCVNAKRSREWTGGTRGRREQQREETPSLGHYTLLVFQVLPPRSLITPRSRSADAVFPPLAGHAPAASGTRSAAFRVLVEEEDEE